MHQRTKEMYFFFWYCSCVCLLVSRISKKKWCGKISLDRTSKTTTQHQQHNHRDPGEEIRQRSPLIFSKSDSVLGAELLMPMDIY